MHLGIIAIKIKGYTQLSCVLNTPQPLNFMSFQKNLVPFSKGIKKKKLLYFAEDEIQVSLKNLSK